MTYRWEQGITGPLFLGMDTHALSEPALISAVEVFAANKVDVRIHEGRSYTPTPVISHAIVSFNRHNDNSLSDGIVITPSHNPPEDGGFKYNPPHGGPAGTDITNWVQERANDLIKANLQGVRRLPFGQALASDYVTEYDYITPYVDDLENVVDMEAIRKAGLEIGVDPLGGSGLHFWSQLQNVTDWILNWSAVKSTRPSRSCMSIRRQDSYGLFISLLHGGPD